MNIAFLILCHKNPDQINVLIRKLSPYNIFIHIDKKNYDEISDKLIKDTNVKILPKENCYSIDWGSNEMVRATLELIKCALNSTHNFLHFCLLSGQDLPLIDLGNLDKVLDKDTNYIDIIDQSNPEYNRYLKLYEIPYPSWMSANKIFNKIIKRIYMLITGGFKNTFKIFKRKKPMKGEFYFGSQWWILNRGFVLYLIDFIEDNNYFLSYFDKCIIPDECFFQTIIKNSKYNKNISNSLTYVNWNGGRRSPDTFKITDISKLKNLKKNYLFARKFDESVDAKIIEIVKEGLI